MLASMINGQSSANPFANMMSNPMALMVFAGKGGSSMKDIMMLQMLQNGGLMVAPRTVEPAGKVTEKTEE